jgi:hypothetical protein
MPGEGTEPSNRRLPHPITLYRPVWPHRPPFCVWRGGGARPPGVVIHCGVDRPGPWWIGSFMRNSALIMQAYSKLEWSYWLCVYSWWSCYVMWWWDGFQYSSARCQSCVGAGGYALSCLTLNDLTAWGTWLLGHLPGTGNPQVWLLGAWVCAELGHKEEIKLGQQVGKSCPLVAIEGDKRLMWIVSRFSLF